MSSFEPGEEQVRLLVDARRQLAAVRRLDVLEAAEQARRLGLVDDADREHDAVAAVGGDGAFVEEPVGHRRRPKIHW